MVHGNAAEKAPLQYLDFGDGHIYYNDLFQIDLNTDLLILDGCTTGVGEYIEGEGNLGLARGSIFAGAKNVMVSRVPVSDKDLIFFKLFYSQYPYSSYAYAMQYAQKQIIELMGGHPASWAKYMLEGK